MVPRYVNNPHWQVVIALTVVQDISFSAITNEHLSKLNILPAGSLELKPNSVLAEQAKKNQLVGKDDIWSSENLYRHPATPTGACPKVGE
jgi:hypothetical protein